MSKQPKHLAIPLDLAPYASVTDAVSTADALAHGLTSLAARALNEDNPSHLFGTQHMFLLSALARARGLHDGIAREIDAGNPHAVFPLIRTYLELGGQLTYVNEKPSYCMTLMTHPRDLPKGAGRVSFEAVLAIASRRYPGIKAVWVEMSEFAHFGSSGVWASWTPGEEDGTSTHRVQYQIPAGWRDPTRDPMVAAVSLVEMNEVASREAMRFLEAHVLPLNRTWQQMGISAPPGGRTPGPVPAPEAERPVGRM
jgi:hypothetical protein